MRTMNARRLCFLVFVFGILSVVPAFPAPKSEKPDLAEKPPAEIANLRFISRRQHNYYTLKYTAMPDQERFQIVRNSEPVPALPIFRPMSSPSSNPSAARPERETFILKVGETVDRFRIESVEAREAKNDIGVIVDASVLTITYLPTGKKYKLTRGLEKDFPTYYAEFMNGGDRFFVKMGDTFNLPGLPKTKFQLDKVDESSVEISFERIPGQVEKVTLKKKD